MSIVDSSDDIVIASLGNQFIIQGAVTEIIIGE